MLHHKEAKEANPTFKWGMKKGIGGTHNDIQFYASFTYNGIEYSLYDCVYMLRKNVAEPDIGKLVKIWETPSHAKKVKTVQFFRPAEIHSMLADYVPLCNEIFLACGEGKGLAYLNPLGAICGKCNVVCTSNDKRNTQPSKAELKLADYIFCRTFDVGSCKLSNKFPYAIAGVKVECFFNKKEESRVDSTSKLNVILKEKAGQSKLSLKLDKVDELVRNVAENGSCDASKKLLKESMKTVGSFSEGACCTDQVTALKADSAETLSTNTSEEQILKKSAKMKSLDKDAERQLIGGTKRKSASRPKAVIETAFRPEIPWDERMKKANRDGTLVFLENLDPSYTSSEIEDLIWRVFKEKVDARMIERTSFSSPNYGEAFVIFKMKILADLAISELNRRFLLLDGRKIWLRYHIFPSQILSNMGWHWNGRFSLKMQICVGRLCMRYFKNKFHVLLVSDQLSTISEFTMKTGPLMIISR